MSTSVTDECIVCFNANNMFKVLRCGHEFCAKCCEKLEEMEKIRRTRTYRGDDTNSDTDEEPELTIVCPKCRDVTDVPPSGTDGLKTRFVGKLMCHQCDTEKLTKDFQWCHTCNRSVCSTCFLEKHRNPDGRGIHESSKWDSHMGVRAAVSRLMQMSLNHNQITDRCKTDVAKYLDGLSEYLTRRIDETAARNKVSFTATVKQITEAYGIRNDAILTSKPISDDKVTFAINEAQQVARLPNSYPEWTEVNLQQFPYEELAKSFLDGNILQPTYSFYNLIAGLQSKLVATEFVGRDKIYNPVDFIGLNSAEIIILDGNFGPYHCRESVTTLIRTVTEGDRVSFGRLLLMPHNRNQIMVTVEEVGNHLYFLLTKGKFNLWRAAKGNEWKRLPSGSNVVSSSERVYTCSCNGLFVYNHADKLEFSQIFQSTYKSADLLELCHVTEMTSTTDFYVAGNNPQRLEVIKLDKATNSLISWTNVNLNLLSPGMPLSSPTMTACGPDGLYLVWDRQSTKLFLWNVITNSIRMIADFCTKSPQVVQICGNFLYAIIRDGKVNRTERIKLCDST